MNLDNLDKFLEFEDEFKNFADDLGADIVMSNFGLQLNFEFPAGTDTMLISGMKANDNSATCLKVLLPHQFYVRDLVQMLQDGYTWIAVTPMTSNERVTVFEKKRVD